MPRASVCDGASLTAEFTISRTTSETKNPIGGAGRHAHASCRVPPAWCRRVAAVPLGVGKPRLRAASTGH
eukprot:72984-Chlamydomonas_euryale.AAC.6